MLQRGVLIPGQVLIGGPGRGRYIKLMAQRLAITGVSFTITLRLSPSRLIISMG